MFLSMYLFTWKTLKKYYYVLGIRNTKKYLSHAPYIQGAHNLRGETDV